MTSWRYKVYMMLIMDFHLCCLNFTHFKNRGSRPLVFCNLHLATMRIAVFTASDICSLFNALVSTYKVPFDRASSQASLLDTKLAFLCKWKINSDKKYTSDAISQFHFPTLSRTRLCKFDGKSGDKFHRISALSISDKSNSSSSSSLLLSSSSTLP